MLGMRVSEGSISNGSEGIDVNGLTAGTYFLQVTPNNGYSETLQFVKSKR
jgi:hypothetical protein